MTVKVGRRMDGCLQVYCPFDNLSVNLLANRRVIMKGFVLCKVKRKAITPFMDEKLIQQLLL